ncbi:hypothetical protein [Rhizobium indigoferae]|uniref:Phytase-like domain-containing protein n=1 Tax=Rhizobium indigoferae TaxID=158891 RepID=A0ABZ1DTE8_9HYPH|nr:hypothetical protein [Rhizobium indigoferae]NNU52410.1 hypothetical protein [Rhizobium indigoferae]WRW38708.1 hypothetical protein U5G49_005732 [Rhizobium indigoferae]GLR57268.1 hypothetical protein GCM10007919_19930 [Rhizobium indigoferae]
MDLPYAPMGGVDFQSFTGHGIRPTIRQAPTWKNQGINALIADDGEFYILFEWSFDNQPPHHRILHDDAPASIG